MIAKVQSGSETHSICKYNISLDKMLNTLLFNLDNREVQVTKKDTFTKKACRTTSKSEVWSFSTLALRREVKPVHVQTTRLILEDKLESVYMIVQAEQQN